jgi:hypothetical protein
MRPLMQGMNVNYLEESIYYPFQAPHPNYYFPYMYPYNDSPCLPYYGPPFLPNLQPPTFK